MTEFERSQRSTVRRLPKRATYDRRQVYEIIDEGLFCHVGFETDGQPVVIPTLHARRGDELLLHGSAASRLVRRVSRGHPVCVTVTLVDGLVLARSAFHHSINYRSVVLFGRGRALDSDGEKLEALEVFTRRLMPGRWEDARRPNPKELAATGVAALSIEDASAKVRSGPPADDEEDYDLPVWAGVLPLSLSAGEPLPDARLDPGITVPAYVADTVRRRGW
jgi:nitroimidazol reductase NimA-like FMN-containing flavoprotein (pyridoxamine 5'-phosphate oxidase superfamily)